MFAPVLGLDEAAGGGPVEAVPGGSAASSGAEASPVDAAFLPPDALLPGEPPGLDGDPWA